MSETTKTEAEVSQVAPHTETDPAAGLDGAASFADAETREILNLLGNTSAGGSCCGGSCCA